MVREEGCEGEWVEGCWGRNYPADLKAPKSQKLKKNQRNHLNPIEKGNELKSGDFAWTLALCVTLDKTPWAPVSLSVKWVSTCFIEFSQGSNEII